jgi:integrase
MKKRKDGRYLKVITDKRTKKRLSFYGKSVREVNQKILEYQAAQEHGRLFSEVAEEWWDNQENALAPQSVKGYKSSLGRVVDFFGARRIKEITPTDILDFYNYFAMQNKAKSTVLGHRTILRQILDHAVVFGDIQFNPCASVRLPKGLKETKRTPATPEDERLAEEYADVWLLPFFALKTGLRRGELLALQWQDIDFDRDLIFVTKSASFEKNNATIKTPKTEAGNRLVPLLPSLKEKLLAVRGKDDEYVFGGKKPLTEQVYLFKYKKYKEKTGTRATAHQFRHSYATIIHEAGIDVKDAQGLLGHAHASTTLNIYTHFREKSLLKSADLLKKADEK